MKPKYLYKYQPFSIYSIQNLKNNCIYFNDPFKFNDPYDTRQPIEIEDLNNESIKNLLFDTDSSRPLKPLFDKVENGNIEPAELTEFLYYLSVILPAVRLELEQKLDLKNGNIKIELLRRFDKSMTAFNEYLEYSKKAPLLHLRNLVISSLEKIRELKVYSKGVSCFSEIFDDLLMWAYYADGHRGFCLEFDTSYEPFSILHKVNYVSKAPKIDSNKIFTETSDHSGITEAYLATKYKDWAHEKEWRVIHMKKNFEFILKPNAVSGLYFGSEIDFVNFEIIALIVRSYNPHVKFYQMQKVLGDFKVVARGVEYASFQEAKEKIYLLIKSKLEQNITDVENLISDIEIGATKNQLKTMVEAIIDDMKIKKDGRL